MTSVRVITSMLTDKEDSIKQTPEFGTIFGINFVFILLVLHILLPISQNN